MQAVLTCGRYQVTVKPSGREVTMRTVVGTSGASVTMTALQARQLGRELLDLAAVAELGRDDGPGEACGAGSC